VGAGPLQGVDDDLGAGIAGGGVAGRTGAVLRLVLGLEVRTAGEVADGRRGRVGVLRVVAGQVQERVGRGRRAVIDAVRADERDVETDLDGLLQETGRAVGGDAAEVHRARVLGLGRRQEGGVVGRALGRAVAGDDGAAVVREVLLEVVGDALPERVGAVHDVDRLDVQVLQDVAGRRRTLVVVRGDGPDVVDLGRLGLADVERAELGLREALVRVRRRTLQQACRVR